MPEVLKPLCWFVGKWRSISALATYPTIPPYEYCEELNVTCLGQPILNFNSLTWSPKHRNPVHIEAGFIRINETNGELAFLTAHNRGLVAIEVGRVSGEEIRFKTSHVKCMSFFKEPRVCALERVFKMVKGQLNLTLSLQTSRTPLTKHLEVVYERDF